ncbi:2-oxoglutarate and iron-dependent oxygenase JMJD4-like [Glandiceps talaboti]
MDEQVGRLSKDVILKTQQIDRVEQRQFLPSKIDYIDTEIGYMDFFLEYLFANKPCIVGKHVTEHWRSCREWVAEDGMPNFDFLVKNFGSEVVPVADCAGRQYDSQPKQDMTFTVYIEYWKTLISSNYDSNMKCLYLKDWHFNRSFPEYQAYKTPVYFTSDWLNEFWDSRGDQSDDYRFVYMGPKGSWTPFHADVFRSFSWSANVCGRKKWLLYPPGQEQHLKDCHGNLAYDVTSSELHDGKKYPNYHKVSGVLEIIQEAGEAIFVPSGWFHQVFNLEDTISINHNWVNGCNVDISWKFLQNELQDVQNAISDCRDMDGWHQQCQMILRANSGMDYADFFTFLLIVAKQRMKNVNAAMATYTSTDVGSEVNYHDIFDLQQVSNIVDNMLQNEEFLELEFDSLKENPRTFLSTVKNLLDKDLDHHV